jgi:hypothetical protein
LRSPKSTTQLGIAATLTAVKSLHRYNAESACAPRPACTIDGTAKREPAPHHSNGTLWPAAKSQLIVSTHSSERETTSQQRQDKRATTLNNGSHRGPIQLAAQTSSAAHDVLNSAKKWPKSSKRQHVNN